MPDYTDPTYTDPYIEEPYEEPYEEPNFEMLYQGSLEQWNEDKKAHNNSYQFSLMRSSAEGNYTYTTTIVVTQGKITNRQYEELEYTYDDDGNWVSKIKKTWSEEKDKIGTNSDGFKAQTFDDLYASCQDYIKADLSEYYVFLDTGYYGLISVCGTSKIDCQDDCFEGYSVSNFEWLE